MYPENEKKEARSACDKAQVGDKWYCLWRSSGSFSRASPLENAKELEVIRVTATQLVFNDGSKLNREKLRGVGEDSSHYFPVNARTKKLVERARAAVEVSGMLRDLVQRVQLAARKKLETSSQLRFIVLLNVALEQWLNKDELPVQEGLYWAELIDSLLPTPTMYDNKKPLMALVQVSAYAPPNDKKRHASALLLTYPRDPYPRQAHHRLDMPLEEFPAKRWLGPVLVPTLPKVADDKAVDSEESV